MVKKLTLSTTCRRKPYLVIKKPLFNGKTIYIEHHLLKKPYLVIKKPLFNGKTAKETTPPPAEETPK